MKHRATKLILFLLLGAIINLAVAWACVWVSPRMFSDGALSPPTDVKITNADDQKSGEYSFWRLTRCDRFGAARYNSLWASPDIPYMVHKSVPPRSFLSSWAGNIAPWQTNKKNQYFYRGADARGWPMLSMYSWWDGTVTITGSSRMSSIACNVGDVHLGIRLPDQTVNTSVDIFDAKVVPLGIIPVGFLFNSLLYAPLGFVLVQCIVMVRSHRRVKRGLCPACAYDLRGSTDSQTCPECGKAVKA